MSSMGKDEVAKATGPGLDSLQSGDRVGEYILEEPLGQGGCGTVWRARHAVLPGVIVAVKLPRDPELIGLLRRESLLQHGLDHPGVLKVIGVDLDADVPYVVQEYAEGGDLAALIRKHGELSLEKTLSVFREIVEILSHAHSRGVVHSDLKPGNILLDKKGRVRIADFGLGKGVETLTTSALRESIASLGTPTDGRYLGGTWEYMAPELREEDGAGSASDPRIDIYALGIVLYEMLTGKRPVGRVSLDSISPDVDAVFARCWTARDLRYKDAGELLKDVRRLTKKKPVAKPPAAAPQQTVSAPIPGPRSVRGARYSKVDGLRWIFWAYLVPLTLFMSAMGLIWFHDEREDPIQGDGRPVPEQNQTLFPQDRNSDEADELREIRLRIQTGPYTVDEAAGILREFRVRANDPVLVESARRWEEALPTDNGLRKYEVRWKRFKLDPDAYRETFYAGLEPGEPDVYVRIYRERDGDEDLVFDTADRIVEAWSKDWTGETEYPALTLDWARGDVLRVELLENDIFGDNTIASYRLGGEISILLLSTIRQDAAGHAVEFVSDFGFGK